MALKSDYKTAVLEFLNKHPNENVTRDELISSTNISKSRLSEVLQSIRKDGYAIATPPRSGIIRLEIKNTSANLPLPSIKDSDIRKWLILFLLSKYEKLTFRELLLKILSLKDMNYEQSKILIDSDTGQKPYDNNNLIKIIRNNSECKYDNSVAKDIISVTSFRNDLKELRNEGLVILSRSDHTTYHLSNKAPVIITISGDSLFEFCYKYEDMVSATSDIEPRKQVYNKIKEIINFESDDIRHSRFGRSNNISRNQIDTFNRFISQPYKSYKLRLTTTYDKTDKPDLFTAGLLFYCVETGSFYALGRNFTKNRIESRRLDLIEKIEATSEVNSEFHQKNYYKIYNEMFSAQYEEKSHHVKVYIQDFGNVLKRFYELNSIRTLSTIRHIDNPPANCPYAYVYEDTIRGLSDFARYLRGFGISVLAAAPAELQEKMQFTYNRIIEKYEVDK